MLKAIEQLKAKLESIGATLDPDCDYTLNCDAPSGYVWVATGSPTLAIHYATNHESWLTQALREEMPNLKMGLRLADGQELADARHDNDDDNWGAPAGAPDKIEWPK